MHTMLCGLFRPALRALVLMGVMIAGFVPVAVWTAGPVEAASTSVSAKVAPAKTASKKAAHRAPKKVVGVAARGAKVVRFAARQAGDPYRYGATGPNAFDCSGLTSFVYRKAVHKPLPRTSKQQRTATRRISRATARPGDLVFFHGSSGVYHVGIYAGRNMIWHAPYTGARVRKERIWTRSVSYGRVR